MGNSLIAIADLLLAIANPLHPLTIPHLNINDPLLAVTDPLLAIANQLLTALDLLLAVALQLLKIAYQLLTVHIALLEIANQLLTKPQISSLDPQLYGKFPQLFLQTLKNLCNPPDKALFFLQQSPGIFSSSKGPATPISPTLILRGCPPLQSKNLSKVKTGAPMARRKKNPAILGKLEQRLAGLKSIAPKVDLGNGLTAASFEKEVNEFRRTVEAHNVMLSQVDDSANKIQQMEKKLSISAENVLIGVKFKYGKDSSEYEMVGGTRQSDRRRRTNRTTTPTGEVAMA